MSGYTIGKLREDAQRLDRGGWIVGSFFAKSSNETAGQYSEALEVKYWTFPRGGGGEHGRKISKTTEWTLILEGQLESLIDGKLHTLNAGDYTLIQPGVPNNLVNKVVQSVVAITVKAPSDATAKTLL